jgi:mono/diheme cytochrome c family protein
VPFVLPRDLFAVPSESDGNPALRPLSLLLASVLLALLAAACGGPSAPQPPAGTRAAAGKELFTGEFGCNTCHPGGHKGVGRNLVGPEFQQRHPTDATVRRQIRNGGGGMPPFGPARMSEQQLRDVIAYIRWMNAQEPAK